MILKFLVLFASLYNAPNIYSSLVVEESFGTHCKLVTATKGQFFPHHVLLDVSSSSQSSAIVTTNKGVGSVVKWDNLGRLFCLTVAHAVKGNDNTTVAVSGITVPGYCVRVLPGYQPLAAKATSSDTQDSDAETHETKHDFATIFLRKELFSQVYQGQCSNVASKIEIEHITKNLSRLTFCVPVTFCGVEECFGDTYKSASRNPEVNKNMGFVFSGADCSVLSNGILRTPACTVKGNSGSPLIILQADGDDMKSLVGKTVGVCSYGRSTDIAKQLKSTFKTKAVYSLTCLASGYVICRYAEGIEKLLSNLKPNYPLFSYASYLIHAKTPKKFGKNIMLAAPAIMLIEAVSNFFSIAAYLRGGYTERMDFSCFQLVDSETLNGQTFMS
jgi:hypothetical protein